MFAAQIGRWHRGPGYGRVMGRIIYDTAASMNGWIADEDNSLDWLFEVAGADDVPEELSPPAAAVMVMGAHTYEWVLGGRRVAGASGEVAALPRRGADLRLHQPTASDPCRRRHPSRAGDRWNRPYRGCVRRPVRQTSGSPAAETSPGSSPIAARSTDPAEHRAGESDRRRAAAPATAGAHRLQLVAASQVGQFVRVTYEVRGS